MNIDYFVSFDVCALVILAILAAYVRVYRVVPSKNGNYFKALIFVCFIAAFLDIITAYTNGNVRSFGVMNATLLMTLYLLFMNSVVIFYFYYEYYSIKGKDIFDQKLYFVATALALVMFFLIILSPVSTFIFYFKDGIYYHGWGMTLLYLCNISIIIICIAIAHRHHDYMYTIEKWSYRIFIFSTLGAVIFQYFFPKFLITCMFTAIACLLMYISIQNPEMQYDKLTRVFTRESLARYLEYYVKNSRHFKVLTVRIDDIHTINGLLGVTTGDLLIARIADYLRKEFKKYAIFHTSGAEFSIIFLERELKEETLRKLRAYFDQNFKINNYNFSIQYSFSIVAYPDEANNVNEILDSIILSFHGDMKYDNGYIHTINQELLEEKKKESAIVEIIKEHIKTNDFDVSYQPIYDVKSQKFHSAEALVRLNDSNFGFIPPNIFIPIAERHGFIIDIGNIVFEKICQFISQTDLKSIGIDCIEFNLSPIQCLQENLAQDLKEIMEKYGVPQDKIRLEITEKVASNSSNKLQHIMEDLIKAGFKFSFDDFGTSLSISSHLLHFPVEIVKLDRSLLADFDTNEDAKAILRHTMNMIHDLRLQVVVEGIESKEQKQFLEEHHCDYLQGYYFSKPLPPRAFIQFVEENNLLVKD